ncbi:hypothetical protein ABZT49_06150 [Methylobacterium sp. EM32]|uniref:hypothetical protein n=1 Tax=Methylobacterium sp. EM32 TaxID=3163481 RepID=UPI0033BA1237
MAVASIPARYVNPVTEAVLNALSDVTDVEEARRRIASVQASTGKRRPAWYREERIADEFAATLVNGAVLAWGQIFANEPWELFYWADADRGTVLWREKL